MQAEVRKLAAATRKNRHGYRDASLILVTYRHGLRVTEDCQLRWDRFDLERGSRHVDHIKSGLESVQPVGGKELRALRRLLREEPESRHAFVSERGGPLSHEGLAKMVKRAGAVAKPPFSAHPHVPCHAFSYKLTMTLERSSSTGGTRTSRIR